MPLPTPIGDPIQSPAMDNATAIAFAPGSNGQVSYAVGFMADFSAAVAALKTITIKRGGTASTGPVTAATLSRGTTDTKIQTSAFTYAIQGVQAFKAAVAAGTTLPAGTIPTNTWGIYLVSINAAGTLTVTPGALNFTTGYASEAAAIAALPATPATTAPTTDASVGYFTVQTKVGSPFVGGTDALAGGASGNVANATNYYPTASIAPSTTLATFTFDFTPKFPCQFMFPVAFRGNQGEGLSAELQASGTGGVTGRVTLFTQKS